MKESRKQQDWFCIKLYIILQVIILTFAVQKDYFQHKKITTKFQLQKFKNTKHYFQLEEITLQRKYKIQNPKYYFQLKEIAANFSYKIQNHRHYLNVSRNIIT